MQTFLPYPSFAASARVLDYQRLGKQRVENLQIMRALILPDYGWTNHPAVRMWRTYETALTYYQAAICEEWTRRGYADTCLRKTTDIYDDFFSGFYETRTPRWLGDPAFHLSHQSNLVRKDRDHYAPHFPGVRDDLDYVWPV